MLGDKTRRAGAELEASDMQRMPNGHSTGLQSIEPER